MSESAEEKPPTGSFGGCLAGLIMFVLFGMLVFWGFSSCSGSSETEPDGNYSEGTLSVKCERAIEPEKAATYKVVDMGENLFIVSGQTTAGEQYHCHYRGGFDNAQLLEVNVGD